MRKNFTHNGVKAANNRTYLEGDWFGYGIPPNVELSDNVYIDTSYGFTAFNSLQPTGMFIDEGSGSYDRSSFITGERGVITVGKFTILNGTSLICNDRITIGNHCMLAWGSVITDSWLPEGNTLKERQQLLTGIGLDTSRSYPIAGATKPVVLEDNCWLGFDSVIMPGVRLGRGCIIGCKTIVTTDVPPYAIVAGSDEKIIRYLAADDTEAARQEAMNNCL